MDPDTEPKSNPKMDPKRDQRVNPKLSNLDQCRVTFWFRLGSTLGSLFGTVWDPFWDHFFLFYSGHDGAEGFPLLLRSSAWTGLKERNISGLKRKRVPSAGVAIERGGRVLGYSAPGDSSKLLARGGREGTAAGGRGDP